jgi:four helix bundle protein
MKSYKELEIYKISYNLTIKVHSMPLKLPQYELYEERSQVRRSSKSVASNIAEEYGRRKYKAEFTKFFVYAHSSCDETILHLNFIKDTHNNLPDDDIQSFLDECDELGSKINRFISYVDKEWNSRLTRNPQKSLLRS